MFIEFVRGWVGLWEVGSVCERFGEFVERLGLSVTGLVRLKGLLRL